MITTNFEMIACKCGGFFPEHELVEGSSNGIHYIHSWSCPFCGGLDYEEVDE